MVIAGIINLDIYYIIIIIKLKCSVPLIYERDSGFYPYGVSVNIKYYRFNESLSSASAIMLIEIGSILY
jgi:hypothetical protein